MAARIIDRGRGPEIAGTRITVYDIMDYYKHRWHHSTIALHLGISSAEVVAAIQYIEEHKEEVTAAYQEILDRSARGNPPEIRAKLKETRARLRARLEELRTTGGQAKGARRARVARRR